VSHKSDVCGRLCCAFMGAFRLRAGIVDVGGRREGGMSGPGGETHTVDWPDVSQSLARLLCKARSGEGNFKSMRWSPLATLSFLVRKYVA